MRKGQWVLVTWRRYFEVAPWNVVGGLAGEDGVVISRKGRRWLCSGRWDGEQLSKKQAKRMKSKAQWYKVSKAMGLANTCENPGSWGKRTFSWAWNSFPGYKFLSFLYLQSSSPSFTLHLLSPSSSSPSLPSLSSLTSTSFSLLVSFIIPSAVSLLLSFVQHLDKSLTSH